MANSRKEYLQSLNRMRNNYQNQGNVLINTEDDNGNVGNELSSFAYMNTPIENATGIKETSTTDKIFGTIDELASQFGSGYVNGWEGMLDFGANGLSWITGNDNFSKWAQQDLGKQASEWVKTYANFTPWSIIENVINGNYGNKEYWGSALSGFGDLLTSAVGGWDENQIAQGILTGGVSTLIAGIGSLLTWAGNALGGTQRTADAYADDYTQDKEKYYGFDDQWVESSEGGQFATGIVHSIGEMLPSIQLGTAFGKGLKAIGANPTAIHYGSKAVSTGALGLSASGHASNEALQDGASKGQAMAYGFAKGNIEAISEWIFPDGGVGGYKVSDVLTRTAKQSIVKDIAKEMLQEGAEEIFSELLDPVAKMIYKDDSWKSYLDKDYWKQVALAGASGAVSGGIMATFSSIKANRNSKANQEKYGRCTEVADNFDRINELQQVYDKATDEQKSQIKAEIEKLTEESFDIMQEMSTSEDKNTKAQFARFVLDLQLFGEKSDSADTSTQASEETNYTTDNVQTTQIKKGSFVDNDGKPLGVKLEDGKLTLDENSENTLKGIKHFTYQKDIPVGRVIKRFNLDHSLRKTIKNYLDRKNLTGLVKYLRKMSGETDTNAVLKKLGYDAIVTNDGEIIGEDLDKKVFPKVNTVDRNGEQYATVAPYFYKANVNIDNLDETVNEVEKQYIGSAKQLSKSLKLKISNVDRQYGSWKGGGELSYSWQFDNNANPEAVKMFAYLQSDLNGEVQNAVITGKYLSPDTDSDFSWEFRIGVKDSQTAHDILIKCGLDDNTIKINGNTVQLFDDGSDNFEKRTAKAVEQFIEKGIYNGNYEKCKCETQFGNAFDRRSSYKERLSKGEDGGQKWDKVRYNDYQQALENVEKALDKWFSAFKNENDFIKYCENNYLTDENGKINDNVLDWKEEFFKRHNINSFEQLHKKIISDVKKNSSTTLIEAGADVSKATKVRINSVKEAFETAINEFLPDNGTYKLEYKDIKSSYAELNLAEVKDRNIAVNNMMDALLKTKVTLVDVFGGKKMTFGNLLTIEQEEQARKIMLEALEGKAEPTKLAKWAKSLQIAKIENFENMRSVVLLNTLNRRINASMQSTFGYGDEPTGELTLYRNIVKDLPLFWSNSSASQLATNVLRYYTEENLKSLSETLGIQFNNLLPQYAQMLQDRIVKGKHLDAITRQLANDMLVMLNNDLKQVSRGAHNVKTQQAQDNLIIAQSMNFGKGKPNVVFGKAGEILSTIPTSIVSPVSYFQMVLGEDAPVTKHLSVEAQRIDNIEREHIRKFKDEFFDIEGFNVQKKLAGKITFKGEKLTYAQALKRLNLERTLGEKFYKAKGSIQKFGKRVDVVYTKEDIQALRALIPQDVLDYNEKYILGGLNRDGGIKSFIKEWYKKCTGCELVTTEELEQEKADKAGKKEKVDTTYYKVSRKTDKVAVKRGDLMGLTPDLRIYNERVNSVADLNFDGDVISDINNYIETNVHTLVWYGWTKQLNVYLNQRVYGTTLNAYMQKTVNGWNNIIDLIYHDVLGVPYEGSKTLFGKILGGAVSGLQRANILGIQTALRTQSSKAWFASYFGVNYALAGEVLNVKHGGALSFVKNRQIIEKYSPYLKDIFTEDEVISAQTSQKIRDKISHFFGTPLRISNAEVHCTTGFSMAQAQATAEGYGDPYTESNNKRAVQLLEEASKKTQPTMAHLYVGGFRYGQYGQIIKKTFGMYASMQQSFFQGVYERLYDLLNARKKIARMDNAIKHHQERQDFYQKELDSAKERMANAETQEEYEEAQKDAERAQWKVDEHKYAQAKTQEYRDAYASKHTGKLQLNKTAGAVAGLVFSSLLYVLIGKLIKKLQGQEEWDDWDTKKLTTDTVEQMFFNSFPYLSTIYYSIKNNSDMSVFTIDNLNNMIKSTKGLFDAISSGNIGEITGSGLTALFMLAQYFGIPAQSMYKIVNGVWYNIDHDSNIRYNNWLGRLGSVALRNNYNSAVDKKQYNKAYANLEVWLSNNAMKSSKENIDEIYRLNVAGIDGIVPSAIPASYTTADGANVKLTSGEKTEFRRLYALADAQAKALIQSDAYRALDDEYKGKALKSVYSSYYRFAKNKVFGLEPSGKVASLLYHTNGDVDLAKYIVGLQTLSTIKETKTRTRKEMVISAINKMVGYTRQEKLLLAYLCGYSVNENNKNSLTAFLVSKGFTRKDAIAYLQ